jgi:hypothetical protein
VDSGFRPIPALIGIFAAPPQTTSNSVRKSARHKEHGDPDDRVRNIDARDTTGHGEPARHTGKIASRSRREDAARAEAAGVAEYRTIAGSKNLDTAESGLSRRELLYYDNLLL